MSWTKRIQHPSEVVKKGDEVAVVVLGVDPENKRISLGMKQATDDPFEDLAAEYRIGQLVNGPVTRLQDNGVAVDLGNDLEGFVPTQNLMVPNLQNPADLFEVGDELVMRLSEMDIPARKIVLEVLDVPKFEGRVPKLPASTDPAEQPEPEPAAPKADTEAPAEAVEG